MSVRHRLFGAANPIAGLLASVHRTCHGKLPNVSLPMSCDVVNTQIEAAIVPHTHHACPPSVVTMRKVDHVASITMSPCHSQCLETPFKPCPQSPVVWPPFPFLTALILPIDFPNC